MTDFDNATPLEQLSVIQPWMRRIFDSDGALELVPADCPLEGTFWAYVDQAYFELCPAHAVADPVMRQTMGLKLADRIAGRAHDGVQGKGLIRFRLREGVKPYAHFEALGFDPAGMFGQTTSSKLVLAFPLRSSGEMACVIKSASLEHIAANLKTEMDALQAVATRVQAPCALLSSGVYESGAAPVTSVQSWCAGERLSGTREAIWTQSTVMQISRWLRALVDPAARQVSLRELANEQAAIVKVHPRLEEDEKQRLCMVLAQVRDDTPVASSRLHGDMRPENILLQEDGRFVAVDWEFSRPRSLGLLDLMRYLLESVYGNSQTASFAGAMTRDAVQWIRSSGLPGAGLPIPEMANLQFVMHYTDRIGSFGRRSKRMQHLQALLQGECERLSL